jgi:hypothetical protein
VREPAKLAVGVLVHLRGRRVVELLLTGFHQMRDARPTLRVDLGSLLLHPPLKESHATSSAGESQATGWHDWRSSSRTAPTPSRAGYALRSRTPLCSSNQDVRPLPAVVWGPKSQGVGLLRSQKGRACAMASEQERDDGWAWLILVAWFVFLYAVSYATTPSAWLPFLD